jgi:hypothetical protein
LSDKRAHDRYTLWFPVRIDNPSGKLEAVCHDASVGGVLISSSHTDAAQIEVGEAVMVAVPGTPEGVLGRVVRIEEPRTPDGERRMAIEFIQPVPGLEAMFKRVSSFPPPVSE